MVDSANRAGRGSIEATCGPSPLRNQVRKLPTRAEPEKPSHLSLRTPLRPPRITFDLAPAGGPARLGVGQRDAEHRAGPPQCRIDEHRPVVDVELRGPTTG